MNLKQIKKQLTDNPEEVLRKLNMDCEVFGDNIYSVCPVHESSDNPRAFSFSKKHGIWKCWTRGCQNQYKNDIFGLIRGVLSHQHGLEVNFGKVLSWINKEFGISADGRTTQTKERPEIENSDFDNLIKHLKYDVSFPEIKNVELNTDIEIPSKYFMNRGFRSSTLKHFKVGDCFDKASKLYERACIPIYNDYGDKTIGYIGRAIKEYKIPKFLIYPKGFDKRFTFYNLNGAMSHIKQSNSVYLVEGQGDVWRLYESGIYNAIGMFGCSLTREQEKKLQQLPITHIIILTDNDQTGRESKIQLQRQLGRFYKLSFPKFANKDIGDMSVEQLKKMFCHH